MNGGKGFRSMSVKGDNIGMALDPVGRVVFLIDIANMHKRHAQHAQLLVGQMLGRLRALSAYTSQHGHGKVTQVKWGFKLFDSRLSSLEWERRIQSLLEYWPTVASRRQLEVTSLRNLSWEEFASFAALTTHLVQLSTAHPTPSTAQEVGGARALSRQLGDVLLQMDLSDSRSTANLPPTTQVVLLAHAPEGVGWQGSMSACMQAVLQRFARHNMRLLWMVPPSESADDETSVAELSGAMEPLGARVLALLPTICGASILPVSLLLNPAVGARSDNEPPEAIVMIAVETTHASVDRAATATKKRKTSLGDRSLSKGGRVDREQSCGKKNTVVSVARATLWINHGGTANSDMASILRMRAANDNTPSHREHQTIVTLRAVMTRDQVKASWVLGKSRCILQSVSIPECCSSKQDSSFSALMLLLAQQQMVGLVELGDLHSLHSALLEPLTQDTAVLTLLTSSVHIDLSGHTQDFDFADGALSHTKIKSGISDCLDGGMHTVSGWRHTALSELFPGAVHTAYSRVFSDDPQKANEEHRAGDDICNKNIVGGLLLNQARNAGFAAQAVGNVFHGGRPGNVSSSSSMLGADFVSALANMLTPLSSPDSHSMHTSPQHKDTARDTSTSTRCANSAWWDREDWGHVHASVLEDEPVSQPHPGANEREPVSGTGLLTCPHEGQLDSPANLSSVPTPPQETKLNALPTGASVQHKTAPASTELMTNWSALTQMLPTKEVPLFELTSVHQVFANCSSALELHGAAGEQYEAYMEAMHAEDNNGNTKAPLPADFVDCIVSAWEDTMQRKWPSESVHASAATKGIHTPPTAKSRCKISPAPVSHGDVCALESELVLSVPQLKAKYRQIGVKPQRGLVASDPIRDRQMKAVEYEVQLLLRLRLAVLFTDPHTKGVQDPMEAARLAEAQEILVGLTMLMEPIGEGVRRFMTRTLLPTFHATLPRTLAAFQKVLNDDSDSESVGMQQDPPSESDTSVLDDNASPAPGCLHSEISNIAAAGDNRQILCSIELSQLQTASWKPDTDFRNHSLLEEGACLRKTALQSHFRQGHARLGRTVTVRLGRKAVKGTDRPSKPAKPEISPGRNDRRDSRNTKHRSSGCVRKEENIATHLDVPRSRKGKERCPGEALRESNAAKARVVRGFLQSPGGFNKRAARKSDNESLPGVLCRDAQQSSHQGDLGTLPSERILCSLSLQGVSVVAPTPVKGASLSGPAPVAPTALGTPSKVARATSSIPQTLLCEDVQSALRSSARQVRSNHVVAATPPPSRRYTRKHNAVQVTPPLSGNRRQPPEEGEDVVVSLADQDWAERTPTSLARRRKVPRIHHSDSPGGAGVLSPASAECCDTVECTPKQKRTRIHSGRIGDSGKQKSNCVDAGLAKAPHLKSASSEEVPATPLTQRGVQMEARSGGQGGGDACNTARPSRPRRSIGSGQIAILGGLRKQDSRAPSCDSGKPVMREVRQLQGRLARLVSESAASRQGCVVDVNGPADCNVSDSAEPESASAKVKEKAGLSKQFQSNRMAEECVRPTSEFMEVGPMASRPQLRDISNNGSAEHTIAMDNTNAPDTRAPAATRSREASKQLEHSSMCALSTNDRTHELGVEGPLEKTLMPVSNLGSRIPAVSRLRKSKACGGKHGFCEMPDDKGKSEEQLITVLNISQRSLRQVQSTARGAELVFDAGTGAPRRSRRRQSQF